MLLHVVIQLSQHHLLKRLLSPTVCDALNRRLLRCVGLFLDCQFCPIDLDIYPLPGPESALLLLCSKMLFCVFFFFGSKF